MTESDYTDVRELHPDFDEQECWNCGYTELRERWFRKCPECFMGQEQHDGDGEFFTAEGYIDYRLLWYGDVDLAEAKRRYDDETKEMREQLERDRARKRAVWL